MKEFYCKNKNDYNNYYSKNYVDTSDINYLEIKNGYILPAICVDKSNAFYAGGVVDNQKKFVAGLVRQTNKKRYFCCESSYDFNEESCINNDCVVIFGGILINHFGHFILEGLSRLWFVVKNNDVIIKNKVVFVTINGISDYFYDFFELLNIPKDRIIFIDKIHKFSKIIIPDESIHSWENVNKAYTSIFDSIVSNALCKCTNLPKFRYLYLSKSEYKGGAKCIGEQYFEEFYKKKGFVVMYPEKLPVVYKVYILNSAEEIVTTLGTCSHLFLFAKAEAFVTILLRTFDDFLFPQILINVIKKLKYCYVDVSCNLFYAHRSKGVVLLGPTLYWNEYTNDKYNIVLKDVIDINYFLEYLKEFYKFNKLPFGFEKFDNLGVSDILKRLGLLLFNETYNKPNLLKKYDYENDVNYYKYLLSLINESEFKLLKNRNYIYYSVHIYKRGTIADLIENSIAGSTIDRLHIEGISINFVRSEEQLKIHYKVYYGNGQWSSICTNGEFCGTIGRSKPIYGISISLSQANTSCIKYKVLYRIFNSKNSWSCWVEDGFNLISDESLEIYCVQIKLSVK